MSGLHFRSLLENDVFVDVFGHPQRTHIIKSFLNAVFAAGGFPLVTTLTLLPRENSRSEPGAKLTIVDVKAETETGETIQVEVQFQLHAGLSERMVYTWTQTYGRAIVAGKSYAEALPIRSVWILGENLFTDDGQKLHSFRLHDDVSGRLLNSHCHILTLEFTDPAIII